MKKLTKISVLISILGAFCLSSCATDDESGDSASSSSTSASETDEAAAAGQENSISSMLYLDLTNGKISCDNSLWSEITSSNLKLYSDTISVKSTKTGLIKIDATAFTSALSITISGTMNAGGIKIQSNGSDSVTVNLSGVTINSSNYPCLEVTKGSAAIVNLSGTNVFVDGRSYGYGYGEEEYAETSQHYVEDGSDSKGSLYSKGNLTISGNGSLSVTQAYKNCIASKDGILTIEKGTLNLKNYLSSSETGKNGLFGGQGIIVNGGTITFDGKGIISTSDVRKANAFKTDDDDYPESYIKINGGTISATAYNGKGLNAPCVYIAGGTNTFTVSGVTGFTGDDNRSGSWYDADGVAESGIVKFAAEGIEGESIVEISGGKTIVSALDDGINVSATGGNLKISDGFLLVKARGDGLDSNGNIVISGGTVVVSQTGGGNSPIDCGDGSYSFSVTGGTVFAMGSSDMFNECLPSSTTVPYIYSTSFGNSSSSLGVNGIIALLSPQTYSAALLISSELENGKSCSFVKGGSVSGTEILSGSGLYFPASVSGGSSISATATTQASSMGGFGGGGNPGGMNSGMPGGRR